MKTKISLIVSSIFIIGCMALPLAACSPDSLATESAQEQLEATTGEVAQTNAEDTVSDEKVSGQEAGEEKTITITDADGREVSLNLPLKRVAYMHATIAEGLLVVNAWDRVIAVDNHTIDKVIFPDIEDYPRLIMDETGNIDYEAIIELDPDVFLVLPAAGHVDVPAAIAALEPEIPVISVFNTNDPDAWEKGIELLGIITQQEKEAAEYISFYQDIENKLSLKTSVLSEDEKKRVFLKIPGWSPEQFSSMTNEMAFVKKLMELCGGINIAADLPSTYGWVENVDMEWLMTQEYDYVLAQIWDFYNPGAVGFITEGEETTRALHDEITRLEAFENSSAIENGNLYIFESGLLTSLSYPILLEYTARALHPELFDDLEPRDTMQEYLARFIRTDFKIDSKTIVFYPEK
jgi:iron complex transport system substrate-binding protein